DNYVTFTIEERVWRDKDRNESQWRYARFHCFAMVLDAEAAKLSDQIEWDRASELALANVRLGTMLRRGGTLWGHTSTGEYCESYGYQRLVLIRDRLSSETLAAALVIMRRAAAEPEDV